MLSTRRLSAGRPGDLVVTLECYKTKVGSGFKSHVSLLVFYRNEGTYRSGEGGREPAYEVTMGLSYG